MLIQVRASAIKPWSIAMSKSTFLSSSSLAPKFAAACATALTLATISLLSAPPSLQLPAPRLEHIVTLPTIVVVPDAADRAAAASLQTAGVQRAARRLDEV